MVRWLRWHCPPDTGFEIRALAVWGRARYLSVTEAPHNTNFHTWMGKKQFCFFQTAETGNRTPDSGVKGSGANHYPRAPAPVTVVKKNKSKLAQTSKTRQLWVNYQRVVGMVRKLIKADRTWAWVMYLQAVSNCLTVFAAAGHFNYLWFAHYCLQQKNNLEEKHPDFIKNSLMGFTLFAGAINAGRGLVVILSSNELWWGR